MFRKYIHGKAATPAFAFVMLMGVVSLFADMTHEGARSLYGAYLPLLGASATAIGFVTGFGELVGYALRLLTGVIANKTKKYWSMTLIGYGINVVAIPFLALVPENGWILACMLIIMERTGKAIRQPAKNTLLSFAATQVGVGKAFAVQEFLDQLGAFLGPVILFAVLWFKGGGNPLAGYAMCFAVLAIPALLTMIVLFQARHRFPNPESFEKEEDKEKPFTARRSFIMYIVAISCFALGFVDFPLITMHVAKLDILPASTLPLLYAGAMIVDAFAALFFGWLFDRVRFKALLLSGLLAAFFAVFIFAVNSLWGVVIGIILWGVGMGAQESILKAAVVTLSPKDSRSVSFGLFESCFGLSWFLGSWLMGWLYDFHPVWLVAFSVGTQLLALPLYAAIHFKDDTLQG
ncbi:MFS transporter [Desulfovibrio sp. OttesenSCG-928-A18]|nr:MFS transporter [Desulfovibrio sp. OttesenSCG-928-A18]